MIIPAAAPPLTPPPALSGLVLPPPPGPSVLASPPAPLVPSLGSLVIRPGTVVGTSCTYDSSSAEYGIKKLKIKIIGLIICTY